MSIFAYLVLAGAPTVTAEPGPEYTCLFGYNPTALANVCYDIAIYSEEVAAGGVETTPMEVCPVGNICAPVPVPGYNPEGSVSVPLPGGVYAELQGTPLVVDPAEVVQDFDAEDWQVFVENLLEEGICDSDSSVCIYTEDGDPGVRVCEIVCNELEVHRSVCDTVWYEDLVAVRSCVGNAVYACIDVSEDELACI